MIEPEFLELDVVLFMRDQALREHGGAHGVISEDLLQSAIDRPLNKHAYADPGTLDLFDLAAACAFGLASNHAFNDANKRTAWSCCVLFLKVNGIALRPQAAEVVDTMVRLVEGSVGEHAMAAWLRRHQSG